MHTETQGKTVEFGYTVRVVLALASCILFSLTHFSTDPYGDTAYWSLWPITAVMFVPVFMTFYMTTSLRSRLATCLICFAPAGFFRFWIQVTSVWYDAFKGAFAWGVFGATFAVILHLITTKLKDDSISGNILLMAMTYTGLIVVPAELAGTFLLPIIALAKAPFLLQPLRLVGYYGMEFTFSLMNASLALFLVLCWGSSKAAVRAGGIFLTTVITWLVVSLSLHVGAEVRQVIVATISDGYDDRLNHLTELYDRAMNNHPEIIVWPELAIRESRIDNCILQAEKSFQSHFNRHKYSVIGCGDSKHLNVVLLLQQGVVMGISSKSNKYPVFRLDLASGTVDVAICYDANFPKKIEADLILLPSNDTHPKLRNHYWVSVFRAIESGVSIVKADAGLDSAIIDSHGRVRANTEYLNISSHVLADKIPAKQRKIPFRTFPFALISAGIPLAAMFLLEALLRKHQDEQKLDAENTALLENSSDRANVLSFT